MKMATSNKTIPIIAAGVVLLAAVAYFGGGFPSGNELTGTVAPAERYRAEGVTENDVVLGDQALVDLMQSDAFTMIMNDPELAGLLADARYNEFFADARFNQLMADKSMS